jgi:hypothetical protein
MTVLPPRFLMKYVFIMELTLILLSHMWEVLHSHQSPR